MKHKILIYLFIAVVIALLSLGSAAYFTTDDTAVNVITSGNIKVEILESSISDGKIKRVPFENKIGIVPDTSVSKIVTVKNTGESPEYVRVSVKKEILISGADAAKSGDSLIETDFNTEHWTERNGFWYYNKVLKGGQETEPLFTKVYFAKNMNNQYQNSIAAIDINAFAVQSDNNGSSPTEADGWSDNR